MVLSKFFLSFLLLLSIFQNNDFSNKRKKGIHRFILSFDKKLTEKGFQSIGLGEGVDHDSGKQNYLELVLKVDDLPNIEFARKLIIQIINDFLHEINTSEMIRPYLSKFPFEIEMISISLISKSKKGLVGVSNIENVIIYKIENPDPYKENWITIHKETFREALEILK